jgi:hypothetical protein
MRNTVSNFLGWVKAHPVATAVLVALFAPSLAFGIVFRVLGFIGWGRIFLALAILGGWVAFKFVKSQVKEYGDTARDAVGFAREVKNEIRPPRRRLPSGYGDEPKDEWYR